MEWLYAVLGYFAIVAAILVFIRGATRKPDPKE